MHTRAFGMPSRRARNRSTRLPALALLTAAALAVSAVPAASAVADETRPTSVWGPDSPEFGMPAVKVGPNRPVASRTATNPADDALMPWSREQRERTKGDAASGKAKAPGATSEASATSVVPEGQGDVPWHRYTGFAITDALTARIDYSTGNLMLTATDFDIAGVGQRLTLARTYNSLDAPWGKVSQRWWQQYERYLSLSDTEAVFYDASGATVRFTRNSDGTFTTPKGYSEDLKKNSDGTYTLTKWKSGAKDTYDAGGTLTKVTDRNHGTITVTQHDEGDEHKGFKLTETRSGRWIDLYKDLHVAVAGQGQHRPHRRVQPGRRGQPGHDHGHRGQDDHLPVRLLGPRRQDHHRGRAGHGLHLRRRQPGHLHAARHRLRQRRPHGPDLDLRLLQ
jgi:hypothetical protein